MSAYDDLVDLAFPPPLMKTETLVRLMNVPSRNNKKVLKQVRSGQSTCVLKVSNILKTHGSWLVIGDRGGVCKYCKLFIAPGSIPRQTGKFLSKPWVQYSRVKDLDEHCQHSYHTEAKERFDNRNSVDLGQQLSVSSQVDQQKQEELELRKKRLDSVIRTIMLCGKQAFPLRGHRNEAVPLPKKDGNSESDVIPGDLNRGNFMQLMEFRRQAGDSNVDIHINKKSEYTSPGIQNELIGLIADEMTAQIVERINASPYFAIISDETRDVSNTEQLCIAIRYFDHKAGRTEEKFLCFLPLRSLRG